MQRVAVTFILLWAVASTAATTRAAAQDFVPGLEDVPVMSGLQIVPGAGHIFDTPSGRLVESHARGSVTRKQVRSFYRDTLPALGWRHTGSDTYRRDDEILTVAVQGRDGDITVRFSLTPHRSK